MSDNTFFDEDFPLDALPATDQRSDHINAWNRVNANQKGASNSNPTSDSLFVDLTDSAEVETQQQQNAVPTANNNTTPMNNFQTPLHKARNTQQQQQRPIEEQLISQLLGQTPSTSHPTFDYSIGSQIGVTNTSNNNSRRSPNNTVAPEVSWSGFHTAPASSFTTPRSSNSHVSPTPPANAKVAPGSTPTSTSLTNNTMKQSPTDSKQGGQSNSFLSLGFTTGTGKAVQVKEDNLKKFSAMLDDDPDDGAMETRPLTGNTTPSPAPMGFSSGFQTGSGKQLEIFDQERLKRARALLADEDDEDYKPTRSTGPRLATPPSSFGGFQTGSGKKVNVSDESLQRAQSLLSDEDTPEAQSSFGGFSTGSGRKINVSRESLERGMKLMGSTDEEDHTQPGPASGSTDSFMSLGGFQTGSGKKVAVSEESLKKRMRMMEDDDEFERVIGAKPNDSDSQSSPAAFGGFQTGSGKKVSVSEESIRRHKQLLDEWDNGTESPAPSSFEGFQTCSGKKVSISEEKLKQRQQLMDKDDEDSGPGNASFTSCPPSLSGFSTGSGKGLHLSAESLKKAKNFFGADDDDIAPSPATSFSYGGFSTGSNTKISVSADKLAKAMAILQDDDPTPANVPGTPLASKLLEPKLLDFTSPFKPPAMPTPKPNPSQKQTPFRTPQPVAKPTSNKTPPASAGGSANKPKQYGYGKQPYKTPRKTTTPASSSRPSSTAMPNSQPKTAPKGPEVKKSSHIEPPSWLPKKERIPTGKGVSLSKFFDGQNQFDAACTVSASGLRSEAICMTSENAKNFRFKAPSYSFPIEMLDLVRETATAANDEDDHDARSINSVGSEEMRKILLHFGAAPHVVTLDWVQNHYRWIVWKLAAMERRAPGKCAGICLTPERTLAHLVFRYNYEFAMGHRPPLRKITERDEPAARYMILCVARVINFGNAQQNEPARVELTDGWYGVEALFDAALTRILHCGKIFVGQKLRIFGAQLAGSDQAGSPLEVGSSIHLCLHANMVRRAAWDAKLGFVKKRTFFVNLDSVIRDGGPLPGVEVIVQRVYPVLHMEKLNDGEKKITRTSRAEERAAREHKALLSKKMEAMMNQLTLEADMELSTSTRRKQPARSRSRTPLEQVSDGGELYDLMTQSSDPSNFCERLSISQQQALQEYQDQLRQEKSREIQDAIKEMSENNKRNVTSFFSVKLQDCCQKTKKPSPPSEDGMMDEEEVSQPQPQQPKRQYTLTLWGASLEQRMCFAEGKRLRIFGLAPSTRYMGNDDVLQLQGGKSMKFYEVNSNNKKTIRGGEAAARAPYKQPLFVPRHCVSFAQLREQQFKDKDEFDTVGVVIEIGTPTQFTTSNGSTYTMQNLFVADESDLVLLIQLRESPERVLSWDNIKLMGCFCFSNLIYRNFDERNGFHVCSATELSLASETPSESFFNQARNNLLAFYDANQAHFMEARDRVLQIVDGPAPSSNNNNNNASVPPSPFANNNSNDLLTPPETENSKKIYANLLISAACPAVVYCNGISISASGNNNCNDSPQPAAADVKEVRRFTFVPNVIPEGLVYSTETLLQQPAAATVTSFELHLYADDGNSKYRISLSEELLRELVKSMRQAAAPQPPQPQQHQQQQQQQQGNDAIENWLVRFKNTGTTLEHQHQEADSSLCKRLQAMRLREVAKFDCSNDSDLLFRIVRTILAGQVRVIPNNNNKEAEVVDTIDSTTMIFTEDEWNDILKHVIAELTTPLFKLRIQKELQLPAHQHDGTTNSNCGDLWKVTELSCVNNSPGQSCMRELFDGLMDLEEDDFSLPSNNNNNNNANTTK